MEIKDIITAISIKLDQVFGEGYTIYDDEIPQGFKTPAFLILFLNLENIRQISGRWRVNTLFNIQYFPKNGRSEASSIALKAQQALSQIELLNGSIMLGTNANSEIIDGVAHNFINFNFFLKEIEAQDFMESVEMNTQVAGGE